MSRSRWGWVRLACGLAVLVVLLMRLGSGPFLHGISTIDGWSLAVGAAISVPTTTCCAWRWRRIARGLGVGLPLHTAILAYYRSQFLNTALPGGVLGDVHRGLVHGRDTGETGRALRSVGWDRVIGQVVQILITLVVLLVFPSPFRSSVSGLAAALAAVLLIVVLVARFRPGNRPPRWARVVRAARADLRTGLLARGSWPGIGLASAGAVTGYVATFLVAARTAGATAPMTQLLPLALFVLVATAIPVNIAGWGPREGAAAWAFAAAGLGADLGVATAVVYGVIVLVASLPGAVVLLVTWLQRREPGREPLAGAGHEGASRG
jgi:glycosyltransferase 2 family protein